MTRQHNAGVAKLTDALAGYPEPNHSVTKKHPSAVLADEWLSKLDSSAGRLLRQGREENVGRRVKIAILDTGIDMRNVAFARHVSRGLIKVEDFVDTDGDGLDFNGHGTHSAALLCKIAPEAEIYVGRVTNDGHDDASDSRPDVNLVAKAIRRAADSGVGDDGVPNWDVDIISLSLGYYGWNKDLDDALRFAYLRHKTVLAAASNNGTMDAVAFPANLPTVICINSANGAGEPSPTNPPARPGKTLSILGEQVESAWCCGSRGKVEAAQAARTKRRSGTSVATPIAAGVVALILELAYQGPAEDRGPGGIFEPAILDRLTTYNGVYDLLKDMSDPRGDWLYICPWRILNGRYDRVKMAYYIKYVLLRDDRSAL